jgi:hypothetical protein
VALGGETAGTLPLGEGGTGAGLTATAGAIVYSTATAMALSSAGTSGQVLLSGGTGAPTWAGHDSIAGAGTVDTTAEVQAVPVGGNLTGSVGDADLAAGSVDSGKIVDLSVGPADLADGAVGSTKVADDSLDFVDFEDVMALDDTTEINLGVNNLNIDLDSTGDLQILDAGTAVHIFRDDGNVGIGTTAPGYKLHVAGNARITSDLYLSDELFFRASDKKVFFRADGEAWGWTGHGIVGQFILYEDGSNFGFRQYQDGTYHRYILFANGTEEVYIPGKLGIGTTSPAAKLDVVGTAYLDGLRVDGTSDLYGNLYLNNYNVYEVNAYWVNDPGPNEGYCFSGTAAGWCVDVSPEDRSNADGNLNLYGTANQIVAWRPVKLKEGGILGAGGATETATIQGDRSLYAGDTTEVTTTSTGWELLKQVRMAVFDSDYGVRPRWVNVVGRIHNDGTQTAELNVTVVNCASGLIGSTTSATYVTVENSIDVSGCADGLYDINVYLRTTAGGTAYNDLIEFYWVE